MSKSAINFEVWSNLAYIFVGINCIINGFPLVLGLSCIGLGIFSGIFHYFDTDFTQLLDWIGMYAVFGYITAYSISPQSAVLIYLGIVKVAIALDIVTDVSRRVILGGIVVPSVVILSFVTGDFSALLEIGFIFSAAFTAGYIAEEVHPKYYNMLHGFWHLSTAYGIDKLIKFYF